jgi:hypothetical protein
VSDKLLGEERKKKKNNNKNKNNNNKKQSKHNMSPKLGLGDILTVFLFCKLYKKGNVLRFLVNFA